MDVFSGEAVFTISWTDISQVLLANIAPTSPIALDEVRRIAALHYALEQLLQGH
jgi:hypothetical protein